MFNQQDLNKMKGSIAWCTREQDAWRKNKSKPAKLCQAYIDNYETIKDMLEKTHEHYSFVLAKTQVGQQVEGEQST